ncbi:MAG: helix-turn-helix domain-containing protein [Methanobacterium sp.]|uniref:helix-turn-helix domain-containing protein n=1 Tax=Methanobacterium sp. TaxID=2164 RepID=UPI003D64FE34|nr:helix-turn-helix domain-containing protein [Methanobacterium sp.]
MDDEIYINKPLSSQVIMELLEKYPHLKKIKSPRSLYARTSKKYLDALSKLGIEVEPVDKRGRPKKYDKTEAELIQKMLNEGSSTKEISQKLQIPLKTVYYLKDTKLKRGRKPKYSKETEDEVKNLHKNGVSAKDISKKLNIPLRTVYCLLKRKND